jgi:hypothetical protein
MPRQDLCPSIPGNYQYLCEQTPGCSWAFNSGCTSITQSCNALSATDCLNVPGCTLVDGGGPPQSPFVGKWALGSGGGTANCQSGTMSTSGLGNQTFSIFQLTAQKIEVNSNAVLSSNASLVNTRTVLTINGNTATGKDPMGVCFGLLGCDAISLSYDSAALEAGVPVAMDAGDGGSDDGDAATPTVSQVSALSLYVHDVYDTTNFGPCMETDNYALVRMP